MKYDYLVVGAGLYGAVFAHEAAKRGKQVLVIDRREHIGGNCYTVEIDGITVHRYGAHIFHTNDTGVWNFMNQFAEFRRYTHMPIAKHNGKIYALPFNMHTLYELWGVTTEDEARAIINRQIAEAGITNPKNLEEQAISMVGKDVYEALIKGYTEKQWNKPCTELPASIIKRIPVRFTWDNSYFTDTYQGIPKGGYTQIFEKLLKDCTVKLETPFEKDALRIADKVIYTGCIDQFFDYSLGKLDYRSVTFAFKKLRETNFQGCSVVNYSDHDEPYTRIIEHKHFDPREGQSNTILSYEYSVEYNGYNEPSYPINDDRNNALYAEYTKLATKYNNIVFGGRLGMYKYMDMDTVVRKAIDDSKIALNM